MTTPWDATRISSLLSSAFAPSLASSHKNLSTPPTASIDVLITFDAHGVSGHTNHISLYHGARAFVAALVRGKPGWQAPVDLYILSSVALARKYTGFLDVLATLVTWALRTPMRNKAHPGGLVFLSGVGAGGVATGWSAMTAAHKSQMVWFRYGWIALSRYMYMNDLRLDNRAKKS